MSGSYLSIESRKVRMIEAWVSEVKATPKYCQCSRTRVLPRIEEGAGTSKSSSLVSGSNQSDRVSASLITYSPNPASSRWRPKCSVCGMPFDDSTKFEKLRELEGVGLVRSGSPRSVLNLRKGKKFKSASQPSSFELRIPEKQRVEHMSLKERLSGSLKSFKSLSKNLGRMTVESSRRLKAKGMESLRSLKTKILEWPRRKPPLFDDCCAVRTDRPRATEAYAQYRRHATTTGSVEDPGDWSGDDDPRKPGLTIDESAARLSRAARLLNRTNPHSAIKTTRNPPAS
ncbi:hypothetical protein F4811DRAFT_198535 [Daldinia bambusicola]|nr:hypothetical protein F4811DRAFT_198535 [Daldinia bambusicola]